MNAHILDYTKKEDETKLQKEFNGKAWYFNRGMTVVVGNVPNEYKDKIGTYISYEYIAEAAAKMPHIRPFVKDTIINTITPNTRYTALRAFLQFVAWETRDRGFQFFKQAMDDIGTLDKNSQEFLAQTMTPKKVSHLTTYLEDKPNFNIPHEQNIERAQAIQQAINYLFDQGLDRTHYVGERNYKQAKLNQEQSVRRTVADNWFVFAVKRDLTRSNQPYYPR